MEGALGGRCTRVHDKREFCAKFVNPGSWRLRFPGDSHKAGNFGCPYSSVIRFRPVDGYGLTITRPSSVSKPKIGPGAEWRLPTQSRSFTTARLNVWLRP